MANRSPDLTVFVDHKAGLSRRTKAASKEISTTGSVSISGFDGI